MRLVAKVLRMHGERRRREALMAKAMRSRRGGEEASAMANLPLPSSSMLRSGGNEYLSVTDEVPGAQDEF